MKKLFVLFLTITVTLVCASWVMTADQTYSAYWSGITKKLHDMNDGTVAEVAFIGREAHVDHMTKNVFLSALSDSTAEIAIAPSAAVYDCDLGYPILRSISTNAIQTAGGQWIVEVEHVGATAESSITVQRIWLGVIDTTTNSLASTYDIPSGGIPLSSTVSSGIAYLDYITTPTSVNENFNTSTVLNSSDGATRELHVGDIIIEYYELSNGAQALGATSLTYDVR